ncbi:hypothetical protein BBJ28_00010904 [Nothophytophthora sp. Chile5]|nr:hypothetical protein BBJ28_00010904 [Nothophytophthora sp. Chile5]
MTKKRRVAAPARLRSSLKARATRRPPRRRAFSEGDVRSKLPKREATGRRPTSSGGSSAETVAHFQALQAAAASAALAEVYEWLGDAVIGELVGRCLLSQFHRTPLSARVFRNLRLAVVTNRNLAQVHDAMGYGGVRRRSLSALAADGTPAAWKPLKMKERADVVEAVVGELVLRLHAQKQRPGLEDGNAYRTHLDAVVATMLQTHFAERTRVAAERGETVMAAKGPLSVAFNPFSCLPDEQLDEDTGELVVHDGVFEHEAFAEQEEEEDELDRSFSDLIEEYKDVQPTTASAQHHYFPPVGVTSTHSKMHEDSGLVQLTQRAMLEVNEAHVLRTSSEIFEVFKVYGMAVLSERMSLALALPHVSLSSQHRGSFAVTPARLTRQRQLVLSVANLASCAIALGIAQPSASEEDKSGVSVEDEEAAARRLQEQRGRANTLRAFAGFHSAVATTSSTAAMQRSNILVSAICATLHGAVIPHAAEEENTITPSSNSGSPALLGIPEREPLVDLMRAVGETRMFMNSKACDELHAKGERPVPAATSEAKHEPQVSLLLRRCDSDQVEDLFDTLEKEQNRQRQLSEAKAASQQQQKRNAKKKKSHLSTDGTGPAGVRLPGSLDRFLHRRFLFCLEEIVVLFAQRKTEECRGQIARFEHDLEPCADPASFRKWEVSTSTLTLAMRDSFYRLLLHDVCQFHAVVSSSRSTRDGTRITQLRLPLHYTWAKVATRITTEQQACC